MQSRLRNVLLVRIDRIGDLILSLPADEGLRATGAHVEWWIPTGLSFITSHSEPPRPATEIATSISFFEFFKLLLKTRRKKFDAAVVFHAPWWISLLVWFAGVPVRVGVKSQWHSYLFFNRALRQKRSQVAMHELDYNIALVEEGLRLASLPAAYHPLRLIPLSSAHTPSVITALKPEKYFVIHPGMGGSALNWPIGQYIEAIGTLKNVLPVIITGTSGDKPYLDPVKQAFPNDPAVIFTDTKLNGQELLTVLARARAVLAPSTGVVHLAASLGVRTLGIFSPVLVESTKRWGPRGPRAQTTSIESTPKEVTSLLLNL